MNSTDHRAPLRTEPLTYDAPATQERSYTTQQLADLFETKASTIGSWASRWLNQVAPLALLKTGKGIYTELAHTLMQEFVLVDEKERPLWVADAKHRYSTEWASAGVIDCETMPENVGGTLAILSANNSALQKTIALQLAKCDEFIDTLNTTDSNISKAEMEQAIASGSSRALQLYQAEEAAKAQMTHLLRQRRMNGGAS